MDDLGYDEEHAEFEWEADIMEYGPDDKEKEEMEPEVKVIPTPAATPPVAAREAPARHDRSAWYSTLQRES